MEHSATQGAAAPALPVVIIGAGPAGLTAAHQLAIAGVPVLVLEESDTVGGISQTVERDGWRFDIGGHRFFTKVPVVEQFWHEMLSDEEFLQRPRLSRIFYRGTLFDYPLRPLNALRGLGFRESVRAIGSYAAARIRPPKDQSTFPGWVTARFGKRLYEIFFKTYTEKVWGVPATAIQADWAAQRIKNLSLSTALIHAIFPRRGQTDVTTLIDSFQYPTHGPGMMWERVRDRATAAGARVELRSPVTGVQVVDGLAVAVETGDGRVIACRDVISSMPLSELVAALTPAAPAAVRLAADALRYRDFLTVALVVPETAGFADNWIYIHSPDVRVGRIQNYGSWSPYLVKDGRTCLGLEYFVNEGDDLWARTDDDLIALATAELEQLDLVSSGAVERGFAVRVRKAYPVYDATYQSNVTTIREWLAANARNVHPVGRNGMHRYNNQDHSMVTAMLTAENILGADHDVWAVNVDATYHESGSAPSTSDGAGTGRQAPVLPADLASRP